MRILVLGADGYLGWPTALHLSARDHEVFGVDNLIRRRWDEECGTDSLIPLASIETRLHRWREVSGRSMEWRTTDLCDADAVYQLISDARPDAIVHFAEQRSAPYSMISRETAVETQHNNVIGTLNLLFAMRELAPQAHLIKLGTMGEYGTPNIDIEEGFIDIEHNGRRDRLPFPKQPGSLYHLSKVHDSHNIHFACRIWGMRSTDLNQGVVYGVHTDETVLHPDLLTRFDYDGIWGTVLNRFCVQAAIGEPLTVHGRGGQTRGFLDIRDTVRCIELAALNPPDEGEYRVFNQFTEQFSILGLAEKVRHARAEHGLDTVIDHIPNPRAESEEHYYNAKHQHLLDLGLEPHNLGDTLIDEVVGVVEENAGRVRRDTLAAVVDWRRGGSVYAGASPRAGAEGDVRGPGSGENGHDPGAGRDGADGEVESEVPGHIHLARRAR